MMTAEAKRTGPQRRRRRIWVQHVAVETDKLRMRLNAAQARGDLTTSQQVVAKGIYEFLDKARDAAFRCDPVPGRWTNWWRGTLVEAAYRNLHAARAQMVDLYDENQLRAEIPLVVARANATLHRDDPRRTTVEELEAESTASLRPRMRRVISDSYEQLDLEHARLRSFRNILLTAAFFVIVLIAITLAVVSLHPGFVPLCFPNEVIDARTNVTTVNGLNCPTGAALTGPQAFDILVVAMLGALGGALAATLSIRTLKGTSTPYDVPVALAILKVPLGALTAMLALVAIQGKFVPGLSVLDSQGQILAYALVFGFAQQAISRLLDRQAQTLLEGLPGGTATEPKPPGSAKLQKPDGMEAAEKPRQPDGGTPVVETPAATDTTTTTAGIDAPRNTEEEAGRTSEATGTDSTGAEPILAGAEEGGGEVIAQEGVEGVQAGDASRALQLTGRT